MDKHKYAPRTPGEVNDSFLSFPNASRCYRVVGFAMLTRCGGTALGTGVLSVCVDALFWHKIMKWNGFCRYVIWHAMVVSLDFFRCILILNVRVVLMIDSLSRALSNCDISAYCGTRHLQRMIPSDPGGKNTETRSAQPTIFRPKCINPGSGRCPSVHSRCTRPTPIGLRERFRWGERRPMSPRYCSTSAK